MSSYSEVIQEEINKEERGPKGRRAKVRGKGGGGG